MSEGLSEAQRRVLEESLAEWELDFDEVGYQLRKFPSLALDVKSKQREQLAWLRQGAAGQGELQSLLGARA